MARRTMNTTPERSEYRKSFVACAGGLRFRMKGTSGLEGRRIFMDSLHVDRRPSGDGVVRSLRGIPTFRIVGPEHVDLHTELSLQEAEVFPEHRELVHGRKPGELIRFGVSQVLRDFLGERRDLFRPFAHPRFREGSLHEHVHRDRSFLGEVARDPVDVHFPSGRCVQCESLRSDPRDFQNLADISERRLEEDFRAFGPRIHLATDRLRVARAVSAKSMSAFGSSRPSPAFAPVSRITAAPHSRTASRMYQTFPRDFDILRPARRTHPFTPNPRGHCSLGKMAVCANRQNVMWFWTRSFPVFRRSTGYQYVNSRRRPSITSGSSPRRDATALALPLPKNTKSKNASSSRCAQGTEDRRAPPWRA